MRQDMMRTSLVYALLHYLIILVSNNISSTNIMIDSIIVDIVIHFENNYYNYNKNIYFDRVNVSYIHRYFLC